MSKIYFICGLLDYFETDDDSKYEGEDKERYLHALHQIDTVQDYEPLKKLIVLSVADTYERIKKIGQNKKQHSHH